MKADDFPVCFVLAQYQRKKKTSVIIEKLFKTPKSTFQTHPASFGFKRVETSQHLCGPCDAPIWKMGPCVGLSTGSTLAPYEMK